MNNIPCGGGTDLAHWGTGRHMLRSPRARSAVLVTAEITAASAERHRRAVMSSSGKYKLYPAEELRFN